MALSPTLISITRKIDWFTDASGTWVAWLNVPLVLAVSYEVFARYLFNAPTIWVFDDESVHRGGEARADEAQGETERKATMYSVTLLN